MDNRKQKDRERFASDTAKFLADGGVMTQHESTESKGGAEIFAINPAREETLTDEELAVKDAASRRRARKHGKV